MAKALKFLLSIAIGPVGRFIPRGRRSRDLWWGSAWLSECTIQASSSLDSAPADPGLGISDVELLLPTTERLKQVAQERENSQSNRAYNGRISNHIYALVQVSEDAPTQQALTDLARRSETAARTHLAELVRRLETLAAPKTQPPAFPLMSHTRIQRQRKAIEKGDFIEFYAAWVPWDPAVAMAQVGTLLSARKGARLFPSADTWTRNGVYKSHLDPGRDSVLNTPKPKDRRSTSEDFLGQLHQRLSWGIRRDEELDAIGLARRLAHFSDPALDIPKPASAPPTEPPSGSSPSLGTLPFPPIPRVAAHSWLSRIHAAEAGNGPLHSVRQLLDTGRNTTRGTPLFWFTPARDPGESWLKPEDAAAVFPYDAAILFEGALEAAAKDLGLALDEVKSSQAHGKSTENFRKAIERSQSLLDNVRPHIETLRRTQGSPSPYYAMLAMDGDGVGNVLHQASQLGDDLRAYQDVVNALDTFARDSVNLLHRQAGCAFFVGGDDVSAYLPLEGALPAVHEIQALFNQTMHEASKTITEAQSEPNAPALQALQNALAQTSVSAGVVIAHMKSDLRRVRQEAEGALKRAKRLRRKASGESPQAHTVIVEMPRSGPVRTCEGPSAALSSRLKQWIYALKNENLSKRSIHILGRHRKRFGLASPQTLRAQATRPQEAHEVRLALAAVHAQAQRSDKDVLQLLNANDYQRWADVDRLMAELHIAARLSSKGER